jgi:YVTN family beta-propeller protein
MAGASLSRIDVSTGVVSEISAPGMPIQTAVTPDNRFVFASLYVTKEILRYSVAGDTTDIYSLPPGSEGPIQLYPVGNDQLLICDQGMLLGRPASNKLYLMDCNSGVIHTTITVGDGAHGVVSNPDATFAFCTNKEDNSISVVNLKLRRVECTIPVGVNPNGITYWYEGGAQP